MIGYIERRMVFKPTQAARYWQTPPPELHIRDVELPLASGQLIHAWWCAPVGWQPSDGALHYSHGNSGNVSTRLESLVRFRDRLRRGVLIYDYPGFGRSTGKPNEVGCYAAAEAAQRWIVQEMNVPAERIILFGASLGGAMAIELATRHPYRALVLVATFTSVPDMARKRFPWLPIRRLLRNRFDNLARIGRCPGRVFLAHGTADTFVPFCMGERLFAAAREPKRFFPMVGYHHQNAPGPDFYAALERFLGETASVVTTG